MRRKTHRHATGGIIAGKTAIEEDADAVAVSPYRGGHVEFFGYVIEHLRRPQCVAAEEGNLFDELLETVRVATLGQIVHALYQVCGRYRRSM